jgi:ribulose-5-phosphate 4-epimerase/fuculose-1-phosphate aldolase
MDYAALRAFYHANKPEAFEDVEKTGSQQAKNATLTIDALPELRPSVEAGFHSLLGTFVIHSHSVYANLTCCAAEMQDILKAALKAAPFAWGSVPYIDPGARLSFSVLSELKRVEAETGRVPAVLFMQNHGIIVHADTADECIRLHDEANELLAAHFDLKNGAFLATEPEMYIAERIRQEEYAAAFFMEQPLYPDQMVFFIGTLEFGEGSAPPGKAKLNLKTGAMSFGVNELQARALTDTLAAVLFIEEHLSEKGYTLLTMGEQAKAFIANWESEKYRKSLAGGTK